MVARVRLLVLLPLLLIGCDPVEYRGYVECEDVSTGDRFIYKAPQEQRMVKWCPVVNDTEGWERLLCLTGPQAVRCRRIPPPPESYELAPPNVKT